MVNTAADLVRAKWTNSDQKVKKAPYFVTREVKRMFSISLSPEQGDAVSTNFTGFVSKSCTIIPPDSNRKAFDAPEGDFVEVFLDAWSDLLRASPANTIAGRER